MREKEKHIASSLTVSADSEVPGTLPGGLAHIGARRRYFLIYLFLISAGAAGLAIASKRQMAGIGSMWGLAILAGWITARMSSTSLRRGMRRLREAADALGRGELGHRIDLGGHDDFVKLAEALDRMAARLEAHIGERESLQKDLARAEKLASLGELAATVAHEVNNPLDGLQNAVRIIRRTTTQTDQTAHLLDLMEAGLCRIERHVQRLMGLARCEPPQLEPICLSDVIDDALLFVQPRLNRHSIRVVLEGREQPFIVMGDRMQLTQVLINLLLNAADAMPTGGRLKVRQADSPEEGKVVLELADTGSGITPEHLPRIFEPFFTTKLPGQGTGLGLAVVARIIEAHHGRVQVRSATGEGTTFRIELPSLAQEAISSPHSAIGLM